MTVPYSAQQLNALLDRINADEFKDAVSKPELVSAGPDGPLLSIPIHNNADNILFRRRPDGIWEIEADAPKDPLDFFAAPNVRSTAVVLLRDVRAAAQRLFPSDDLFRIQHLVYQAFEEANHSPAPMTEAGLLERYKTLRN